MIFIKGVWTHRNAWGCHRHEFFLMIMWTESVTKMIWWGLSKDKQFTPHTLLSISIFTMLAFTALVLNTLRQRQNGRRFADDVFKCIFWNENVEFRLKFHWSLFLTFQSTIFQHCFRYWPSAVQATSLYQNQWWLIYWCIYASFGLSELKYGVSNKHRL